MECWGRGLTHHTAKVAYAKAYRGTESHTHCQIVPKRIEY